MFGPPSEGPWSRRHARLRQRLYMEPSCTRPPRSEHLLHWLVLEAGAVEADADAGAG